MEQWRTKYEVLCICGSCKQFLLISPIDNISKGLRLYCSTLGDFNAH